MELFQYLPTTVLQMGAIFLSILIEALPFVLLGSVISGLIEVFISPEKVHTYLPKHKFLRIVFGIVIGFFFPSCECGIVPIVHRLLNKKVPAYTAIPFLITAPIINPIVLFSTYTAFGNSFQFALYRLLGAVMVAVVLGVSLAFFDRGDILQEQTVLEAPHSLDDKSLWHKLGAALPHAVDDFFDTGRYLVFGCLFASFVQVSIPTSLLTAANHSYLSSILLMMILAFLLSLCSEADAFIGASFLSTVGFAPVMAFLVIGPMVDIKNLLMMKQAFKTRFIVQFVTLLCVVVFVYCSLLGGMR